MTTNLLNTEPLMAELIKKMNAELLEAAEPHIQKALKDVEISMRRRLAEMLISRLEDTFSVERYQNELRIIVHQNKGLYA